MMNFSLSVFPLVFLAAIVCTDASTKEKAEHKTLYLGKVQVKVRVAQTLSQRKKGLMGVTSLETNEGMLFVFPKEQILSFWMKDTLIPLSIGFFNAKGVLLEIQEMQPPKSVLSLKVPSYASRRPAKFALEMNQGWFRKNKIKVGVRLRGADGEIPGLKYE